MAAQHIRFVHMLNEKQSTYRDSPTWWTCCLFENLFYQNAQFIFFIACKHDYLNIF